MIDAEAGMTMGNERIIKSIKSLTLMVLLLITMSLMVHNQVHPQDIKWERIFDTGYNDYASAVCADSLNNIIVTGTVGGTWVTIKYTSVGDTLFQKWFRLNSWGGIAHSIATDPSGNIIVTGKAHTDSTGDDYCTVKYSPDGDIIWVRTLSTDSLNIGEAHGVAVDSEENIIVTGASSSASSINSSPDYLTIKYDTAGNIIGPGYTITRMKI